MSTSYIECSPNKSNISILAGIDNLFFRNKANLVLFVLNRWFFLSWFRQKPLIIEKLMLLFTWFKKWLFTASSLYVFILRMQWVLQCIVMLKTLKIIISTFLFNNGKCIGEETGKFVNFRQRFLNQRVGCLKCYTEYIAVELYLQIFFQRNHDKGT